MCLNVLIYLAVWLNIYIEKQWCLIIKHHLHGVVQIILINISKAIRIGLLSPYSDEIKPEQVTKQMSYGK